MKKTTITSLLLILIFTVLMGIVYPLVITGIAQAFFHHKAEGSRLEKDGAIIGSELIGQESDSAVYFQSRPSAIGYNPLPSGGSNLSWTDKRLEKLVAERKMAFIRNNMLKDTSAVPLEMLFASGSGLDPHISPEAALLQVDRIVNARKFNEDQRKELVGLIGSMTEKRQFDLFGEERINVLLLNLELDRIR